MRDLLKEPTKPWDGGAIELPKAPGGEEEDGP